MHDFPCMIGAVAPGEPISANISPLSRNQTTAAHWPHITHYYSLSLALCISLTATGLHIQHKLLMGWFNSAEKCKEIRFSWCRPWLDMSQCFSLKLLTAAICPQSVLKLRSWGIESTRTEQSGTAAQNPIISGSGDGIMGNTLNKTCIACWGVEDNHRVRKIVL